MGKMEKYQQRMVDKAHGHVHEPRTWRDEPKGGWSAWYDAPEPVFISGEQRREMKAAEKERKRLKALEEAEVAEAFAQNPNFGVF